MSTSFLMSVPSNNPNKPPETDAAGTVTQWVPIPTAFPSQEGCADALISARSGNLTGWDPGYAITVDASVKCWPSGATTCKFRGVKDSCNGGELTQCQGGIRKVRG